MPVNPPALFAHTHTHTPQVTYADNTPNIIVSGSDDSLIKVWDRRMMDNNAGDTAKPVGVLVGHTEGITHLDAKGDGRWAVGAGWWMHQCVEQCKGGWIHRMGQGLTWWSFARYNTAGAYCGTGWYGQVVGSPTVLEPFDMWMSMYTAIASTAAGTMPSSSAKRLSCMPIRSGAQITTYCWCERTQILLL